MKIAIVGAGVSGLSAAYFLLKQDPSLQIEVFEAGSELGGRMATQSIIGNSEVDTGCQYLSVDDVEVLDFIFKIAPKGTIKTLPGPILCLPEGWIIDGDERYYFADGMGHWPRELVRHIQALNADFKIHFQQSIRDLKGLWEQGFESVLVSAPGPSAKHLGAQRSCDYWPCLGVVFSWHSPPREAMEFYAFRDLVFRDGSMWLAHEGLKRQKPELWIAQLAPEASNKWRGKNLEALEDLLQNDLAAWLPAFAKGEKTVLEAKYWEMAFPAMSPDPTEQFPFERQDFEPKRRVYFFGDGYLGVGRAENAIQSALAVCKDFFALLV